MEQTAQQMSNTKLVHVESFNQIKNTELGQSILKSNLRRYTPSSIFFVKTDYSRKLFDIPKDSVITLKDSFLEKIYVVTAAD